MNEDQQEPAPARPRVLYITPIFGYPPFGGPRLRTYNTLRALSRRADVSLYLTQVPDVKDPQGAREHVLSFAKHVYWPDPHLLPTGARGLLHRLFPPVLKPLARRLLSRRSSSASEDSANQTPSSQVEAIADWVASHDVDILWLGFGGISYPLVRLKELTGRPVVLETESVWSRFILRELPYERDPERRLEIVEAGKAKEAEERDGARMVDVTTAVSETDAAYFRVLSPDPGNVMLLANVIDVDGYQSESESSARLSFPPRSLCFTGTFSDGTANVDAALWLLDEVMPRVWARHPDVHVYLVGRGAGPSLRARRSRYVHITGEVPSVIPYLRQCTASVVPLRWESGTRFKILEAFACRAPVISTTLGAEGLEVEHGRHLFLADTADEFAGAIQSLLAFPDRTIRMTDAAYDLVKASYSLDAAERQIGAILARLADGRDSSEDEPSVREAS